MRLLSTMNIPLWLRITFGRKSKKFIVNMFVVLCFLPKKIMHSCWFISLCYCRWSEWSHALCRSTWWCLSDIQKQRHSTVAHTAWRVWFCGRVANCQMRKRSAKPVGGLQQQEHFIVLWIQFSFILQIPRQVPTVCWNLAEVASRAYAEACKMDPYDRYKWSYEAINGVHPYQWPNIYGFPYFFTSK